MLSEAIILSLGDTSATLAFELVFRTGVDYVDEEPICWDNFTITNGGSNVVVAGADVSGTTELVLNFDGTSFVGEFSLEGLAIPFARS